MIKTAYLPVILALASGGAGQAATLTNNLAAWQAGVGTAKVTGTATTGLFDPTALNLPVVSSIPLADGTNLGVSSVVQVQQPENGGFPYVFADGYSGDLFMPQDASGNGVKSETITPGAGISALGFEIAPFSSQLGGPYTVSITLAGGQTLSASLAGGNFNTGSTASTFFGYYGGSVSSFTLTTNDPNGFAFGNFVDVPEPGSWALLGLGLAGLMGLRRRV